MNSFTLIGLILLALVATGSYFYGSKKNRWIVSRLTKEIEGALSPLTTNYVNIGGSIGYNFTYAMKPPYTNTKGTLTLSPRHSLLYRPVSLLIGVRDRLFLNLYTKKKIRAEGHIIERGYYKKAKIEGAESMQTKEASREGHDYLLLWKGEDVSAELEKLLESLPHVSRLRHFCAYPDNKTFFVHLLPQEGQVREDLESIFQRLPLFLAKEKS